MCHSFLGQAAGSSAGTKVFLSYGPRASYGMSIGFSAISITLLLSRGPRATGWVGWGGVYSLRKVLRVKGGDEEEGKESGEVEVGNGEEVKDLDELTTPKGELEERENNLEMGLDRRTESDGTLIGGRELKSR